MSTERLVIYIRVSSSGQTGAEHVSDDTQRDECVKWAGTKGLKILGCIQRTVSSYRHNNLKDLANELKCTYPSATGVLVFQSNRLSRRPEYYYKFRKAMGPDFHVYSATDDTNTKTPIGAHHIETGILHGQLDSALIGQRVRLAQQFKRDLGGHTGCPPYGYDHRDMDVIQPETGKTVRIKKLIEHPGEQAVIRFVKRSTYHKISAHTLTHGVTKLPGSDHRGRVVLYEHCAKIPYHRTSSENITAETMSCILNDFGIKKRHRKWTAGAVKRLVEREDVWYDDVVSESLESMSLEGEFPDDDDDDDDDGAATASSLDNVRPRQLRKKRSAADETRTRTLTRKKCYVSESESDMETD
jgi:DNA invertase Pin-like site-specific DNA recombinase